MNRSWKLMKDNDVLGVLIETDLRMPFVNCRFVANPSFVNYQDKFQTELNLLNSDQMKEWEQAYSEINELDLVLKPNNSTSELITEFILHIDGDKAWFRV